MDVKQYDRKPFTVDAVMVTPQNTEEVAEWCKGEAVMVPTRVLGNMVDLPGVKVYGRGNGKDEIAQIGNYIVLRKGVARVYKSHAFLATFEEHKVPDIEKIEEEVRQEQEFSDSTISGLSPDQITSQL